MTRSDRERIPEWYDAEELSGAPGWRERCLKARLESLTLMVEALGARVALLEGERRRRVCRPRSGK